MSQDKDPHFFKNFILAAVNNGINEKHQLTQGDPKREGDLFYHNFSKIAYEQLEMIKMVEERDGIVYLTALGKKYSKKGFQAYLNHKKSKEKRKLWLKGNRDIIIQSVFWFLSIVAGVIVGIVLSKMGYV